MSAAAVLARGRRAAERLMVDACVIEHQTGSVLDPDTGAETPVWTTVYDGRCRVQHRNIATSSPTAGQQRVDLLSLELQLPATTTGVAVNDRVTITASVHDPDLVNRVVRVNNLMHGTHKTSRRLAVEERTS